MFGSICGLEKPVNSCEFVVFLCKLCEFKGFVSCLPCKLCEFKGFVCGLREFNGSIWAFCEPNKAICVSCECASFVTIVAWAFWALQAFAVWAL